MAASAAMGSSDMQIFIKRLDSEGTEQLDNGTVSNLNKALTAAGKAPLSDTESHVDVGATLTLVVKSSYTMDRIREMIQARHSGDALYEKANMRLIFKGKQLDDPWATLGNLNIIATDTIHLVLRLRGGMAKKGCKKTISKGERLASLSARTRYLRSGIQEPNYTAIIDRVSDPNYVQWAIGQMVANNSMQQLSELDTTAQEITRSDRVAEGVVEKLVPELVQMQQQKQQIEAAMKAIQEGFELGFAQSYTTDKGWEVDGFYNMIEEAKNTVTNALNQQAVQNQINQAVAQAQNQAAQAAPNQAPANADAQMGN